MYSQAFKNNTVPINNAEMPELLCQAFVYYKVEPFCIGNQVGLGWLIQSHRKGRTSSANSRNVYAQRIGFRPFGF
jgi:hypothetical protein